MLKFSGLSSTDKGDVVAWFEQLGNALAIGPSAERLLGDLVVRPTWSEQLADLHQFQPNFVTGFGPNS